MYFSSISQPRVLVIVPNWRSSVHCVKNNIHVTRNRLFKWRYSTLFWDQRGFRTLL